MAEPVDIILLSYNRLDFLAAMVETLEQRTLWPHRLTIVDNASGPPTRRWLREHAGRFHQVVFNARNEHLAAFQRGIAATSSELYVLSDADLIVGEPDGKECWLTRLLALAERHPDFGLLGVRLDSVSKARNARLDSAPLLDGELLETATGVWLNLIRRAALRVPYESDGISRYAIRRAGFRVGVAAEIYATHLGDQDPQRHPDYLARKQAASGWRTTYPRYPELGQSPAPPTLAALALAAPVLAALEDRGVVPGEAVELGSKPLLALAAPGVATTEQLPQGVRAVALLDARPLDGAFAAAGELVVVLGDETVPPAPEGWRLAAELPGPHRVVLALAQLASRPRWRRRLLYSSAEHRRQWLALFAAGCFGDDPARRVYVFERLRPLARPAAPAPELGVPRPGRYNPPIAVRGRRIGALATKLRRLLAAEWAFLRGRGR